MPVTSAWFQVGLKLEKAEGSFYTINGEVLLLVLRLNDNDKSPAHNLTSYFIQANS